MSTVRVAVVGAGVSGASCAWQLLQAVKLPLSLTVFETGRGPGGRAATRRSSKAPCPAFNHGAAVFHIHTGSEAAPLVDALRAAGHVAEWHGTGGHLDLATGTSRPCVASTGHPAAELEQLKHYIGDPGMSSITQGILRLAGLGSVDIRYRTQVSLIQPSKGRAPGWDLVGKDGNHLGEFDWLVITSASVMRLQWQTIFGSAPPMHVAERLAKSFQLTDFVAGLEKVRFRPVHVAMLAWAVADEDSRQLLVESLQALPSDITWVTGDAVLAKVVRQSLGPPYAIVVLQSTAAFAERNAEVIGSGGIMAQMSPVWGSTQSEGDVATALYRALTRLLERLGIKALRAPTLGPILHRWGSAFPEGEHSPGAPVARVIPEVQVAFAGDFMAPHDASVETAMRSGLAAAEGILDFEEALLTP